MYNKNNNKIALLIDAENISEKYIKYILDELSNYGLPTYKKIYGDWSSDQMRKWKKSLLTYAITPVQSFSYTTGKNSSDSSLIIDAMDILYTGDVTGFCIVSSDSDFTRLATRLREAGKLVIGMGERKTPKALISACQKFIFLDILLPREYKKKNSKKFDSKVKNVTRDKLKEIEVPIFDSPIVSDNQDEEIHEIIKAIKTIITDTSNDDGYASLADVGNALSRRYPEFDSRNYGFAKFSEFMASLKGFDITREYPEGKSAGVVHIFVKIKKKK